MHLTMLSVKCCPFCPGLNMLICDVCSLFCAFLSALIKFERTTSHNEIISTFAQLPTSCHTEGTGETGDLIQYKDVIVQV